MVAIQGHSGCEITLVTESVTRIKKIAPTVAYSSRLLRQALKQKDFCASNFVGGITTPLVTSEGCDSDRYWFTMEYSRARNFVEYLQHASVSEIDTFVDKLLCVVDQGIACSTFMAGDRCVMSDKFKAVASMLRASQFLHAYVDESMLEWVSRKISTWVSRIPVGVCHGDLTLSNVLVDYGGNVILLDFLDTFLESPLQDIAKLRQDTRYGWSLNMVDGSYDANKMRIILGHADKRIVEHYEQLAFYKESYAVFQAVNLLRVLCYCKKASSAGCVASALRDLVTEESVR